MTRKEEAGVAAKKLLGYLREGITESETVFNALREELRKGGLTPKDIGTSEKELKRLQIRYCKIAAKEYLVSLRKGISEYASYLDLLRFELERGGLTLRHIGTSERELERLRIKGCKLAAKEYLASLRKGNLTPYSRFLDYIHLRRELEEGGLTPTDIGTSESELKELKDRK